MTRLKTLSAGFAAVACLLIFPSPLLAQAWEKLPNLRLVTENFHDADSFQVTDGKHIRHFRLYLVDAPETTAGDPTMARRVREQTRYFGLADAATTLRFGRLATEQVKAWLAQPFTAYTTGALGLGRSSEPRHYAFIVTADGHDLGALLVRHGLGRAFGVGRADWQNTPQAELRAQLADLELSAALARRGIWAKADPERLTALRATERAEGSELAAISQSAQDDVATAADPVDLNTASEAQLRTLPGIGPALVQRIIAARPFASVDDLTRVPGVGPATLTRLRPLVVAESP